MLTRFVCFPATPFLTQMQMFEVTEREHLCPRKCSWFKAWFLSQYCLVHRSLTIVLRYNGRDSGWPLIRTNAGSSSLLAFSNWSIAFDIGAPCSDFFPILCAQTRDLPQRSHREEARELDERKVEWRRKITPSGLSVSENNSERSGRFNGKK